MNEIEELKKCIRALYWEKMVFIRLTHLLYEDTGVRAQELIKYPCSAGELIEIHVGQLTELKKKYAK